MPARATRISLLTRAGAGTPPVAQIELTAGFIARWRLGRLLGAGAMGTVYQAEDLQAHRTVAIKFLTHIDDQGVLARFLLEGQLLSTIKHPCVLQVHEVQALDGFPYLVTDYVDGGTLRELLVRERRLGVQRAAALMLDCRDGLQACHALGVVHRDLKPENVLLTSEGHARLADLGIAKKYGDHRGLVSPAEGQGAARGTDRMDATLAGALIGTVHSRYKAGFLGSEVSQAQGAERPGVLVGGSRRLDW